MSVRGSVLVLSAVSWQGWLSSDFVSSRSLARFCWAKTPECGGRNVKNWNGFLQRRMYPKHIHEGGAVFKPERRKLRSKPFRQCALVFCWWKGSRGNEKDRRRKCLPTSQPIQVASLSEQWRLLSVAADNLGDDLLPQCYGSVREMMPSRHSVQHFYIEYEKIERKPSTTKRFPMLRAEWDPSESSGSMHSDVQSYSASTRSWDIRRLVVIGGRHNSLRLVFSCGRNRLTKQRCCSDWWHCSVIPLFPPIPLEHRERIGIN